MKPHMIFILAFAFLSACATAPEPVTQAAFATQADIPAARAALKRSLKDPESARFGGEIFKPGAVCGLVNSKNAYGGYVGETPYLYVIATGEVFILQGLGTTAERTVLLNKFEKYCKT